MCLSCMSFFTALPGAYHAAAGFGPVAACLGATAASSSGGLCSGCIDAYRHAYPATCGVSLEAVYSVQGGSLWKVFFSAMCILCSPKRPVGRVVFHGYSHAVGQVFVGPSVRALSFVARRSAHTPYITATPVLHTRRLFPGRDRFIILPRHSRDYYLHNFRGFLGHCDSR